MKKLKILFIFVSITLIFSGFMGKTGYSLNNSTNYTTFYDFVLNAPNAIWQSGAGTLPFPGSDTDSRGFALWRTNSYMEDNVKYPKVLETHPQWVNAGWIKGEYQTITIPENASLILKIGFLKGATNTDGVLYRVYFKSSERPVKIFEKLKTYSHSLYSTTISLSNYEGKTGKFILYVNANKTSGQDWACWVDAKIVYEPSEKPDLIITDFWNDNGVIRYRIKNVGNGSTYTSGTPMPITNKLYINGNEVASDTIYQGLSPNQEIESYFKNYTYPSPTTNETLKVCADVNDVVDESNENNNCKEKVFTPAFGGIKVDTGCPNVKVDIYDSSGKLVKSGYSDDRRMYSTGYTLVPGTYRVVASKEGCTFTPSERTVNVPPNQLVGVFFQCSCKMGPDLVITDILRIPTESSIHYKVKNIGDEATNANFKNALYIDGNFVSEDEVPLSLAPGEEINRKFMGPYPFTPPSDTLRVCADYTDEIGEADESNNCLEVVWNYPDLKIVDLRCDFSKGVVGFTIKNVGHYKTEDVFSVALYVDDQLKDLVYVSTQLNPGDTYSGEFTSYKLPCAKLNLKAVVDINDDIFEEDETNNEFLKVCECKMEDKTPPKIVKGPEVMKVKEDSVVIYWETDEESDSKVYYDSRSNVFGESESDDNFVLIHSIKLTGLKPGTVYEFYVASSDRSGNSVESKVKYFKTLEEEDDEKPNINLVLPDKVLGKINIVADVSDNKGIDRVVFYVDDKPILTDYTFPYSVPFDTISLDDGTHTFSARVFDLSGNSSFVSIAGDVINNLSTRLFSLQMRIVEPEEGATVYGDTPIRVEVTPGIATPSELGITKVQYYINNNLVHTDRFFIENCTYTREGEICITVSPPAPLPFSHEYIYNFTEANREEEIPTDIKVIVYYSTGTQSEATVHVNRRFTPIERVRITRDVEATNNYYTVKIKIKNIGNINYEKERVRITDYHCGFEVGTDVDISIHKISASPRDDTNNWTMDNQDITYTRGPQSNRDDPTLKIVLERENFCLEPGEWIEITYKLVPVLYDQPIEFSHIIGCEPLEFTFWNNSSNYTTYRYPLLFYEGYGFRNLTRVSDYIIVTNPIKLKYRFWNDSQNYNRLLFTMADLAIEKNGTLGFIVASNTITPRDHRHIFKNWGSQFMTADWMENGYLLIVGETDIIPTFTMSCWDANFDGSDDTIHWTDGPYASTEGEDIHPEIFIGRIIGDTPEHLIVPIETSLKVKRGEKEFCRNNSPCASAMVISGVGDHQSAFTCAAEDVVDSLEDEFQVYFLQGSSFHDDGNKSAREKRREAFLNNVPDRDVIVYIDHGCCDEPSSPYYPSSGWCDVITTGYAGDINFGRAAPFIFSAACCTGRYEGGYGFAESLFDRGAGVFIGATETTYGGCCCAFQWTDQDELKNFINTWVGHPNKTIAEAWRERRQSMAYERWGEESRYWSTVYQFYGDPKFDK